jgi:uncharacterized protein (TIGR00369 family)
MTMVLLDNARWDFPVQCFVCEPTNEHGLAVRFYHDTDRDLVTATFTPGPQHTGAPMLMHGGISMALLDEAMAWAAIAIAGRFAVTRSTEVTFHRPIRAGETCTITGRVTGGSGRDLAAEAEIRDRRGRLCVSATGSYRALTRRQAESVTGSASPQIDNLVTPQQTAGA